jgi:cbb3-type cytochrome oxidase maturation protein
MSAIYILMLAGLVIAGGFLIVFLWAVRSGQFDDDTTPSIRILFDDEVSPDSKKTDTG